ncbi:enhancer of yellow 2 transcription factor [Angomonas deanei]|uniref:Transcription factor e(Y)2, putative n=1 Tax=Angomonas deanei TaxID=59799 RepID=A0A7G2CMH9_9TRYP|nr:enhancer of yellow 2 transcription factor [Angomonas deanei]CAD2220144.1 Transcription factor e(y)2, putative [Angomonas deanei]|eukprot:EPY40589.1 enhancer of yellow 2 transcription factor [Angomonas deanei]
MNHPDALPHRAAGGRAYEGLSNAKKIELTHFLDTQLQQGDWEKNLDSAIDAIIARRAQTGESLELGSIVEEALPVGKGSVPPSVREELLRKIIGAIEEEC